MPLARHAFKMDTPKTPKTPLTDEVVRRVKVVGPMSQTVECEVVDVEYARALEARLQECAAGLSSLRNAIPMPMAARMPELISRVERNIKDANNPMRGTAEYAEMLSLKSKSPGDVGGRDSERPSYS